MTPPPSADPELIYQLLHAGRWAEVLGELHRQHTQVPHDDRLAAAAHLAVRTLLGRLPDLPLNVLERLFLLHTGGFYRLEEEAASGLVAGLVERHAADPQTALGYALHAPSHPVCAAVIAEHGRPTRTAHAQEDVLEIGVRAPLAEGRATRSLFRSAQERAFFEAARIACPAYLAYPNVALAAALDFDHLRDYLAPAERSFFFRGLVDCVLFDPADEFRPRYFFELDSPHHDADARQANDRLKERILALAGQRLYRVRYHAHAAGRQEVFVRFLQECVQE